MIRAMSLSILVSLMLALPADASEFFSDHTLFGRGACVALAEGQTARAGEPVMVFAPGRSAVKSRLHELFPLDASLASADATEGTRDACHHLMRGLHRAAIGRLSPAIDDWMTPTMAIRNLPASAILLSGAPTPLTSARDRDRLLLLAKRQTAVPAGTFVAARRYGPTGGHEALELFIGRPTYMGRQLTSLRIEEYVFIDSQRRGSRSFLRQAGVEERVDSGPPDLSPTKWFETSELTAGFVSLDGGKRWQRLTIDVGFEGINYWIRTLGQPGEPAYQASLYTPH